MINAPTWLGWKNWQKSPHQGVIKRVGSLLDASISQRSLVATRTHNQAISNCWVEERRIVESIAGDENLEIQWRFATLREAKAVVANYHKYLSEHSFIKSSFDQIISLSPQWRLRANQRTRSSVFAQTSVVVTSSILCPRHNSQRDNVAERGDCLCGVAGSRCIFVPSHCPLTPLKRAHRIGKCWCTGRGRRSPLWVISGHGAISLRCPLYPQKRTFVRAFIFCGTAHWQC
jgi:hypothetical protein